MELNFWKTSRHWCALPELETLARCGARRKCPVGANVGLQSYFLIDRNDGMPFGRGAEFNQSLVNDRVPVNTSTLQLSVYPQNKNLLQENLAKVWAWR